SIDITTDNIKLLTMMRSHLLLMLALFVSVALSYDCADPCYGNMCCSIPSNNQYYLTSFCDESTACGPGCSSTTYFSADSQRFGCGVYLTICATGGGGTSGSSSSSSGTSGSSGTSSSGSSSGGSSSGGSSGSSSGGSSGTSSSGGSGSSSGTANEEDFGNAFYGTCVKVVTIDAGPNIEVEQEAGMPIIDASPQTCQDLFGSDSCGWSDHDPISAVQSLDDGRPLGKFNVTFNEYQKIIQIGIMLQNQCTDPTNGRCKYNRK
ncbi:hypothetical protein SAMD00019534_058670, partial [Acytostelium subglobosum LB1]|uniref:hypothetical protein n=1 Tax=Acytostelium subglobosum LB1 TaxID=1410327 RepID=UPI000644834A